MQSSKNRGKCAIGSWNEGTCAICPKEIDSEYGCDNNSTLFVCDLLGRFYGLEMLDKLLEGVKVMLDAAYEVLAQANNLGRLPMTKDQEEDKED